MRELLMKPTLESFTIWHYTTPNFDFTRKSMTPSYLVLPKEDMNIIVKEFERVCKSLSPFTLVIVKLELSLFPLTLKQVKVEKAPLTGLLQSEPVLIILDDFYQESGASQ